jgi:hypothetical protein
MLSYAILCLVAVTLCFMGENAPKFIRSCAKIVRWLLWWALMPLAAIIADQFDKDLQDWINLEPR